MTNLLDARTTVRPEPRRKRPARTIAIVMIAIDVVLALVFVVLVRSPTAPTSTEPGTRPSDVTDAPDPAAVTAPIPAESSALDSIVIQTVTAEPQTVIEPAASTPAPTEAPAPEPPAVEASAPEPPAVEASAPEPPAVEASAPVEPPPVPESSQALPADQPASVYYENCDEVRAAGAAPIYKGQPGYAKHLDRDLDGIGCDT